MKIKKQKGFTLIELLVVIAIIGILAAVLMVNLAGTRDKAKDSAIKLEMGQIRTAVESFSLDGGTYVGACAADTECQTLQDAIEVNDATAGVEGFPVAGTSYCVQYTLNDGATHWCVDSTGYAGEPTAVGTCTGAVGAGYCITP